MSERTKIVKVHPYPIKAKMTVGAEAVDGQILKLTPTGFLIDAPMPGLKTGAKFQIAFRLPKREFELTEVCVLVKLYTSMAGHVMEGHFQSLTIENERQLRSFLQAIAKPVSPPDGQ